MPDPIPDLVDLLRRRTLAALAALVAEGTLPAGLDLGRFAVAPVRMGASGDIVVDAGLVYARDAGSSASRLASALADPLRAAPEVAAVAVAGRGLLVLTLHPAIFFSGVRAVLLARHGEPARAGAIIPPQTGGETADHQGWPKRVREGRSLAEIRAEVSAEMRAASAAAAGRASARGGPAVGTTPPPPALPPVVVRGRLPDDGDVLTWIGTDAFRFAVASCRGGDALDLDVDVLGDRTRADPSFWTRYAHARARGILRRAAAVAPGFSLRPADLAAADFSDLTDEGEVALAKLVACHVDAVASGSPRQLASHLRQVASAVHSQWNRSKQQPQLRFVNEELRDISEARLGLVTAAALVLRSGLDILGIAAPDEMR